MIEVEDIVDFLAAKGVKSLHIEMHDSMLKNMEHESILEQFDELGRKRREEHLVLVDGKVVMGRSLTDEEVRQLKNMQCAAVPMGIAPADEDVKKLTNLPGAVVPSVCVCAAKHDQVVHRGDPGAGEPVVIDQPVKATPVPVVEKKAVEPPVEPTPVEPKPTPMPEPEKPAKPVAEKKAVPEPVKKIVSDTVAKTSGKPVYEAFCDLISADDGKVTPEERTALIDKMGLDDLLRVNNDFQLGLDTDKPVDDVRADVAECFK